MSHLPGAAHAGRQQMLELFPAIAEGLRGFLRGHDGRSAVRALLPELGRAVCADRALWMPILRRGPGAAQHQFRVQEEWLAAGSPARSIRRTLGSEAIPFVAAHYDFTRRLQLLQQNQPVVYHNRRSLPHNELALAAELGTLSSLRLPVLARGELVAMFGFDHTRMEWPWAEGELAVLGLLARIIGEIAARRARTDALAGGDAATLPQDPLAALFSRHGLGLFQGRSWRPAAAALLAALRETLGLPRLLLWHSAGSWSRFSIACETFASGTAALASLPQLQGLALAAFGNGEPQTAAVHALLRPYLAGGLRLLPVRGQADTCIGWLGFAKPNDEPPDATELAALALCRGLIGCAAELDTGLPPPGP